MTRPQKSGGLMGMTAYEASQKIKRLSGPIPNVHLFFELPKDERDDRLADIMQHALEAAYLSMRMSMFATVCGIAERKANEVKAA